MAATSSRTACGLTASKFALARRSLKMDHEPLPAASCAPVLSVLSIVIPSNPQLVHVVLRDGWSTSYATGIRFCQPDGRLMVTEMLVPDAMAEMLYGAKAELVLIA